MIERATGASARCSLVDATIARLQDRRVARCPEGKESTGWFESAKRPGQRSSIRARFRAADCRACASRTRCTRARLGLHGRVLARLPKRA
jgi:hypothetical protein